ncbi:MAG: hypothetical protein HGA96_17830 [Desulfobulbaceae bacterium]|nr:hypothetical protein [Desulfobulbaceae bacterium]
MDRIHGKVVHGFSSIPGVPPGDMEVHMAVVGGGSRLTTISRPGRARSMRL